MIALLFAIGVFVAVLATFRLAWVARRAPAAVSEASVFAPAVGDSPVAGALGRLARPGDPAEVDLQRQLLTQAGLRAPSALTVYLAIRTVLALLLPAVVLVVAQPRDLTWAFLVLFLVATIGYYLPAAVVHWLRDSRRARVRHVLPDALDMLVSCLGAGLGLDAALRQVAREVGRVEPEFAAEIDLLNAELQAGIPRAEALSHLEWRVGVDDISALVGVLSQAERYGAGIAESVRVHAQVARRRRILDAERRAAEAAPKLTVVMILFVLPPLFVVLIGPTVVHVVTHLLPMLEGR